MKQIPQTLCKPGKYTCLVPAGLRARIQYSSHGLLEKVIILDSGLEMSDSDLEDYRKYVPGTINLKGGTTWIEGVFYKPVYTSEEGLLNSEDIDFYRTGAKFSSAYVDSRACSFGGALGTRNWLLSSNFNVLPGTVMPYKLTHDTFPSTLLAREGIKFPYIAGVYIFDNTDAEFVSSGFRQMIVDKIDLTLSPEGNYMAQLSSKRNSFLTGYASISDNNIVKGDKVVVSDHNGYTEIMGSIHVGKENVSNIIKCPICGKKYVINETPSCDDPHCMSVQYPDLCRMLSIFGLDSIQFDEYIKLVKSGSILCLTDALLLDKYAGETITCKISDVLRAAVPVTVCSCSDLFERIEDFCSGSQETLVYYLQNTSHMVAEMNLNMHDKSHRQFIEWINDDYNLSTVFTLLSIVIIDEKPRKLDNLSPIFRGNEFVLTGNFICFVGDFIDVLEACGGTISDKITDKTNYLIVGGTKDSIDGSLIAEANRRHVAVVGEQEFKSAYSNLMNLL